MSSPRTEHGPVDEPRPTCSSISEVFILTSELEGERASSFRQERWCQIFLDAGARLRIFNLRGAMDYSDANCASYESLARFRQEGIARYEGPRASVREGLAARVLRRIKHILLVDLYFPNVVMLLCLLHGVLKRRDHAVVLMASSPPFSLAIIGALLKSWHRNKVVFSVDMRDAWALHNALGGIKPLKRLIEEWALKRADHLSTVSKGLAAEFEATYKLPHVKVMYNVATHYLDLSPPAKMRLSEVDHAIDVTRRTLVYTGSAPEGHYDVKSIVGAIGLLRQTNGNLADRIQVVFIGACDAVRREANAQDIRSGDIVFVPHLPHNLVRSVQASASALVFLGHFGPRNMGVVSTKLFEYLCLGQAVLPLCVHGDSDVDLLLRRYCGQSINVHSVTEIAALLARIAEDISVLPRLVEVNRVRELIDDYRSHARLLLA